MMRDNAQTMQSNSKGCFIVKQITLAINNKKKPALKERADYSAELNPQNYFFSSAAGAAASVVAAASDLPPPGTDAVAIVGLSFA
jgi:hypothetical protein